MNTLRIALVAVGLAAVVAGLSYVADAAEPAIETRCPAVAHSNDDRNRSVPSGPGRVVLIAVGTIRQATSGDVKETKLAVERTLYGPRLSVIPLSDLEVPDPPVPMIYCLSYGRGSGNSRLTVSEYYRWYRIFPLDQEPILSAMARAHTGHADAVDAVQLSPDGKQILSSAIGYRKQSTIVWDAESAKILDRNDDGWNLVVWHPDGAWFLGMNQKAGCVRVDIDKKQKTTAGIRFVDARFSRDGETLYCLEQPSKNPGDPDKGGASGELQSPSKRDATQPNSILCCRSSAEFAVEAEQKLDFPAFALAVSADGKQLVAVGPDEVEVISLPGLQSQARSKLSAARSSRCIFHPTDCATPW